ALPSSTPVFEGLEGGVSMKAVLFHQHGGPEVLKYTDAPDPIIRPNEVLVRVRACADEDFVRADDGVRSVRVFQDLRSAVLMEEHCLHRDAPLETFEDWRRARKG